MSVGVEKKISFSRKSSNLSGHQPNIDCYMHKLLHINLKITTNQKPIIEKNKEKGIQK